MYRYVTQRLLLAVPVLLGILLATFALARWIPGDPCRAALGEHATEAICKDYIHRHGLDLPVPVQFGIYIKEVFQGDLGDSIRMNRPVITIMLERLPMTVELSLAALFVAVLVGIPLGIISAVRHNSFADVFTMIGANIGVSMPVFWLGLMLAYVFALLLRDTPLALPPSGRLTSGLTLPPLTETWSFEPTGVAAGVVQFLSNLYLFNALITGRWAILLDAFRHLLLPAVALGTIPLALIARITRSSLLEVLGLDYVRTARAKGLREWPVVMKHALRNALLPVVTVIGLSFGGLLSGAVLTETIFGLPGVGRILYDSITARDYTVVQAFTLVIAVGFVVINLITDLSYAWLDPRIRLS
ncbi:MAG: ABC transporter permease [Anaerolineales bacterium]|nr:ABC transporter permease [Anaerolineales bacterium]